MLQSLLSLFGSADHATETISETAQHVTNVPTLGLAAYLGLGLFVLCYTMIALEHKSKIDKSGMALLAGTGLWVIIAAFAKDRSGLNADILHESQEIFSIVVFLLAAMTIVETLVHYGLFDWVEQKISEKKLSSERLFWILGILTFLLSAVLDNLTTTLIMIQVGRKIYAHKQAFLIFVASTIIAANAGGAFSPLGDVTTIILWLAGKFSATEIIKDGLLPALAIFAIPHYMLSRKIRTHEEAEKAHSVTASERVHPNWPVISIGLGAFVLPVLANLIGLPPFMGLLAGLAILWIASDFSNRDKGHHESEAKIINLIQKTDIATLKFFIGILLAVGALGHLGVLEKLNSILFNGSTSLATVVSASTVLGVMSSILDNVPLVAAAINVFPAHVLPAEWVLLALTAGTGGSLLVVGSAAGVAAMGQVPELTFVKYLKLASIPALFGFIAGIIVWLIQFNILY
ncbi:sodium:proton antiporter NhaD [Candidatus Saccharibacteria bacterium]|nr:sodium:proton antiporter NhaD [Candidatus Saccharibacteria bacterium]